MNWWLHLNIEWFYSAVESIIVKFEKEKEMTAYPSEGFALTDKDIKMAKLILDYISEG